MSQRDPLRRPSARDGDADGAGRITLVFLGLGLVVLVITEAILASTDTTAIRIAARLFFLASVGTALMYALRRELRRRRLAEERLEHAQRLEAIGRLAGGLAHDFNNLLTVINGFTDLVLRRLPEDDPSRADLEAVRRSGEQAGALVDQLLTLSRHRVVKPEVIDPNDTVLSLSDVLGRLLGRDVELEVMTTHVGRVLIDPSQLGQVLLNLVVNARDAMVDGGKLTIATNVGAFGDGRRAVVLTVTDTGRGMDVETARRCFDPFFSTRPRGEGTGLGLATVYAVVAQAGGEITVASAPDQGATFTIRLPQVQDAVVDIRGPLEGPTGDATVLLVDDEEPVRAFARAVLAEHGYKVREAASGPDALSVLAQQGAPDLLVTDVVMPGMGGLDLARRVGEMAPDVPVLFISGYVDDAALREEASQGAALLPKPFLSGDLLSAVDDALNRRPRHAQGSNR